MPIEPVSPNLTGFTYLGRQFIKYGAIALVLMIVGRTFLGAFTAYWKATHPEPPPPPTVGFGLLPQLVFPAQTTESKPKEYSLEMPTGQFPDFGDRAKVFFMPITTPSLLDDERSKQVAAQLGFVFEPLRLDSRTYQFSRTQPLQTTLELDIVTNRFSLKSDYLSRPELLGDVSLPNDSQAISVIKNMLTRADLLPQDLATSSGDVVYMRAVGASLEPAVSFTDAQFLSVTLNRTLIDNLYPLYTPDGKGLITAVLAGALQGPESVVDLQYHYQPVDYTQIHTYPIRTPLAAWKVLQAGEGYVVNGGNLNKAVVRRVSLGYYDSFDDQSYLQPIFVFEGDDGFLGYVSAVDPQFAQVKK